jgi:hypothetical protein
MHGRANHKDFAIYYLSGLEIRSGVNPYQASFTTLADKLGIDTGGIGHATDPPTFILLLTPLSHLPLATAFWVWSAINLMALFCAVVLVASRYGGFSARWPWVFVALVPWYPPVATHFYWGQSKILTLLMFVLIVRWLESKCDRAAGLLLAVAVLTRVFPVFLTGYLVLAHRWRALIYALIGLLIGGIATVVMFGVGNSLSFVTGLSYVTDKQWLYTSRNIALSAFISRIFWRLLNPAHLLSLDVWRRAAIAIAYVSVFTVTLRATLAHPLTNDPDNRIFSLWVVTALLLSPTAWSHYLVILLLPFAQVAGVASSGRGSRRVIWGSITSIALITISLGSSLSSDVDLWIRGAVKECGVGSLLAAYVSVYWFVIDQTEARPVQISQLPAQIWRRVTFERLPLVESASGCREGRAPHEIRGYRRVR